MPRDVKPSSAQSSSVRKAPVMLFDPYSQQMLAYTKPGHAGPIPELHSVRKAGGASKALRVLQLALLSSVAVMIWFMLSILQTTQ